jgi:enoyl-CoA hydratase/carnithine racemase
MTVADSPAKDTGRLHTSFDEGVAWITMDNPGKNNAMSVSMWASLDQVLTGFSKDASVRCVVIRGAGERAFCTGSDIGEKQGIDVAQAEENTRIVLAGQRAVPAFGKPVLAMVSGYCLGGGLNIALGCDLRIAAETASFGIPAAKLGLSYYYTETKILTDLLGPARAKHLLFTGDRIPATRALQIGLADEVVPQAELLGFVTKMARTIAANAPLTIANAKSAVRLATRAPDEAEIEACDQLARACLASDDYAEGRRAFAEKRTPVFTGR